MSDTRIHYGEGVGYFNITMEKEFHIDLEPTLDDSYINVMATLYKERFKDSIDENFMNELSNIIEEAKSTGYTTEIISDSSDFIIKATIDGSTVELFLNYDKPIQMAQPVEAIVNEIPTVAEFNDRNLQLSYHGRYSDPYKNLENVKIDDSKWQHVYGIDYSQNDTDSFSEELTFEFYTANLDKEYEGIDYEHSIEDPVYEANEETITYFSKALDIFSETLGFDIKDYMTTEQILAEFQTINMRNNCEFIGFTSQSINDSLPIPGFTYSFVKTDSIYEFAGIYENSMKLYELDENGYSNKTAYEITFKIHRPVVAEGITRK